MKRLSDFVAGAKGFTLVGLLASAFLVACDSGGSADADSNGDTELKDSELAEMSDLVVSSFDDLPICTDARGSTTAYVKEEKKAYACDGADWAVDATLTDSIRKVRDKKNESTKSKSGKGKGASAGSIYDAENNTLTDLRDGHVYKTVRIGAEIWMAENLNYAYLGKTKDLDSSSFCYNDSLEYCDKYGRLYLWSAAMDSAGIIPGNVASNCGNGEMCEHEFIFRGVCPEGWYLPSILDVNRLKFAIDSNFCSLRATSGWFYYDDAPSNVKDNLGCRGNGTDDYGFTELPAGWWDSWSGPIGYRLLDSVADFWSSSGKFSKIWGKSGFSDFQYAFSVRCIKDPRSPHCKTETEDHCEYGTLTDERDGQTYKTVKIGEQWWMAENLNYAYLGKTKELDSSSFCIINDPAYCDKYGRFYLRSAAMDSAGFIPGNTASGCGAECSLPGARGVCPTGWHVPDSTEWEILRKATGNANLDSSGSALKSTSGWDDDELGNSGNGLDFYGFSALCTFSRHESPDFYLYSYYFEIESKLGRASFWSSSGRYSNRNDPVFSVFKGGSQSVVSEIYGRNAVASVRCIKD